MVNQIDWVAQPIAYVSERVKPKYSERDVMLISKTVWGEARGCSPEEQALVVWCICNRADQYNKSLEEVVTARKQFHGYNESNPVTEEIKAVVVKTLDEWSAGQDALVLEPFATSTEYLYFHGDGTHNWFREVY